MRSKECRDNPDFLKNLIFIQEGIVDLSSKYQESQIEVRKQSTSSNHTQLVFFFDQLIFWLQIASLTMKHKLAMDSKRIQNDAQQSVIAQLNEDIKALVARVQILDQERQMLASKFGIALPTLADTRVNLVLNRAQQDHTFSSNVPFLSAGMMSFGIGNSGFGGFTDHKTTVGNSQNPPTPYPGLAMQPGPFMNNTHPPTPNLATPPNTTSSLGLFLNSLKQETLPGTQPPQNSQNFQNGIFVSLFGFLFAYTGSRDTSKPAKSGRA